MIDVADVHPLSEFQRDAGVHLQRLRDTGRPEVLTVDGHPELVVQSAVAYEALLTLANQMDAANVLRERIAAADAGRPGIPASQVLAAIRKRLNLADRP